MASKTDLDSAIALGVMYGKLLQYTLLMTILTSQVPGSVLHLELFTSELTRMCQDESKHSFLSLSSSLWNNVVGADQAVE